MTEIDTMKKTISHSNICTQMSMYLWVIIYVMI